MSKLYKRYALGVVFFGLLAHADTSQLSHRFKNYRQFGEIIFDGPNSHHATAFLMGWTNRLSFMSSTELTLLLEGAQCASVDRVSAPVAGDVGLLVRRGRDSSLEVFHSFVWESQGDKIYSKNSSKSHHPLLRITLGEIEKQFFQGTKCRFDKGNLVGHNCPVTLVTMRCGPSQFGPVLPRELSQLEFLLSAYVAGARGVSDENLKELRTKLEVLRKGHEGVPLTVAHIDSLLMQVKMILEL